MTGKHILAALAFVAVACGAPKGGVPETSRTDDALVEVFNDSVYFNQLYSCARMRYSFDKGTPADFNAWQTEFRAELSEKNVYYAKYTNDINNVKLQAEGRSLRRIRGSGHIHAPSRHHLD